MATRALTLAVEHLYLLHDRIGIGRDRPSARDAVCVRITDRCATNERQSATPGMIRHPNGGGRSCHVWGWALALVRVEDEAPEQRSNQNYRIVNETGDVGDDVRVAAANNMIVGADLDWNQDFGRVAPGATIDIPYPVNGWASDGAGFKVTRRSDRTRTEVHLLIKDIDRTMPNDTCEYAYLTLLDISGLEPSERKRVGVLQAGPGTT